MSMLVIDAGSSSVRALIFDDACQVITSVSRPYQFTTQPPGAAVVDAVFLRTLVESCLDEILQHPAARDIRAAGMSVFVGNLLGLDADGQPVTPLYTYADTRSAAEVEILRERIDVNATHQRTGVRLHSSYHPSRLYGFRHNAQYADVRQWSDFSTYLYRCWFGRTVPVSLSVASWSGMLNRAEAAYDAEWLRFLGMTGDDLPELSDYTDSQTGFTAEYALRWSLLKDVPFFLAVGDGAAANVGSGAVESGQVALTMGTTCAMRSIHQDLAPVPEGLWSYRVDKSHHLTGGALAEGGNLYHWLRGILRESEDAETQILSRESDSHGLTFLPLLAGERAPGWRADATGTISGIRLSTTPLDMLQAGLESVAIRLAMVQQRLMPDGGTIYAGGGAITGSKVWAQIVADTLNSPIHLLAEAEVSARGVAILIQSALKGESLSAYPPTVSAIVEPRPASAAKMQAAIERQQALYQRLYADS